METKPHGFIACSRYLHLDMVLFADYLVLLATLEGKGKVIPVL
jgi:hypothetical protein